MAGGALVSRTRPSQMARASVSRAVQITPVDWFMSSTGATGNTTAAAVERWRRAGQALAEVRREELRGLTDAGALAAAEELLDLLRFLPPRDDLSGLVEQQRIFARLRR
jgi:hypothetical protein